MSLKSRLRRHRKDNRLIIGGLAGLLALLMGIFYLLQRGRDIPPTLLTNKVLLFVLWYVNIVLILAICFVLFRNIIKLLVERHHRILGAKFKTKLVLTYIGLSLIPVLLLFAIATEILQGSVDRWFNTPLAEVLEQGKDVANALTDEIEQRGLLDASRVLAEISSLDVRNPMERPAVGRRMQELLAEMQLDYLAVYDGTEFIHAVVDPQAGIPDLPEPGRSFLSEAATEGEATKAVDAFGGRLILAARARGAESAEPLPEDGGAPLLVVTGTRLPVTLASRMDSLLQAYRTHRQLEVQKDEIKANHLLFFLMVTLLILLTSSWVGLYLARRVTVPIQALADGTRRISGGDLAHRVEVAADDELGVLVDSFNRMTSELERNRRVIERANRELVATNQRLAGERALIAAVVENVAAGVLSLDAEGRIFTCNGAALRMLRQSEAEVVGKTVEEAWADPERTKLATLLREDAPPRRRGREVHLALAGEWKIFEVKVTPMSGGDGEPAGRVVVLEDLTELIKAQKLAAWNEAARRIAHEIKNPLTPIRLSAERLLKKHDHRDPDLGKTLEEAVETIVREVNTMQGMVDEFSRFARMPAPQPAEIDLGRLFEETVHLYRDLKPGVEVAAHVAAEVEHAWLDPEQIKRALINLLDNALEATEAPGKICVGAHRRNGHLEIQVSDSGRGIPAEAKDKLFLPYFSTKGRGTGLGLAIVHRIVADHHGSIRVEDNPGGGTVFTLDLPVR